MTKDTIKQSLLLLIRNRYLATLSIAVTAISIAFIAYVFIVVTPSDLQLITHYSAFGEVHFYRSQWLYLLSFALFGLMLLVLHVLLAAKILTLKGQPLAVAFLWLSLAFVILAWVTSASIINVW